MDKKKKPRRISGIVATILIVLIILSIIVFKGCAKPERSWTVDIGSFHREGNDLWLDITVREVGLNEDNDLKYFKEALVYADLFYGYNGKSEAEPFLKDCQLKGLGNHTIRYLRFFSEYPESKNGSQIGFKVDIRVDGKIAKKGTFLQ